MVVTLLPFMHGLDLGFLAAGGGDGRRDQRALSAAGPGRRRDVGLVVWALGVATTLWPARTAARTSPIVAMGAL